MTQRVFDTDNEQDMKDLWNILPDMVKRIQKDETDEGNAYNRFMAEDYCIGCCAYININWHDKTEITRPIQEATEADVGKICCFWNENEDEKIYGKMTNRERNRDGLWCACNHVAYRHARRLTKKEIEELC